MANIGLSKQISNNHKGVGNTPILWDGRLPFYFIPPASAVVISIVLVMVFGNLPINTHAKTASFQAKEIQSTAKQSEAATPLSQIFTHEIQSWTPEILIWAEEWELDPNLIATVMQIESCGDPVAQSFAGASGLFQVMPFHFKQSENPFNPETNAKRGLNYLTTSIESFQGDIRLAFAGYNAGIAGAKRGEANWPAETIRYTRWASGIYEDAKAGLTHSATLQEWLNYGGASLCKQAASELNLSP